MRDEPFNLPSIRSASPHRTFAAALLTLFVRIVVMPLWLAAWMVLAVLLRLTRPFVVLLCVVAIVGGVSAAMMFAEAGMWRDALKASLAVCCCGLILGLHTLTMHSIESRP